MEIKIDNMGHGLPRFRIPESREEQSGHDEGSFEVQGFDQLDCFHEAFLLGRAERPFVSGSAGCRSCPLGVTDPGTSCDTAKIDGFSSGSPWETLDPFQNSATSEGWPALARSNNAVGGIFARAPTVPANDSQRVLVAGWIETPVPGIENTREILTSLGAETSAKPGLATVGETFLAA